MVHGKIIKFTIFLTSCFRKIAIELLCMGIMGINGNFQILSQIFDFMPGCTFSELLQMGNYAHPESEF
jgi:hypothetical protein